MIYFQAIFLGIVVIFSAFFWAHACALTVSTYERKQEEFFFRRKWVLVTGAASYVFIIVGVLIMFIENIESKTPEPKYELIQEPVYKKIK